MKQECYVHLSVLQEAHYASEAGIFGDTVITGDDDGGSLDYAVGPGQIPVLFRRHQLIVYAGFGRC